MGATALSLSLALAVPALADPVTLRLVSKDLLTSNPDDVKEMQAIEAAMKAQGTDLDIQIVDMPSAGYADALGVKIGDDWASWFGNHFIVEVAGRPGFVFGVEVCEDYWAPLPPSTRQALAGARILLNLSASNVLIGKADERARLFSLNAQRIWRLPG